MTTKDHTVDATSRMPVGQLTDMVRAATRAIGFSTEDAATVTAIIVDADIHGVHSHGVRLLATHLPQLGDGRIRVDARPDLAVDRSVTAVVDGHDGYGPVICDFALTLGLERAAQAGIAAVSVRNSSHWGCPSWYARRAAADGKMLIAASNTSSAMPLWGARERSVGNNPLVIGVPNRDGEPWVLDMAMQRAAWGKLALYRDEGRKLPEPMGLDEAFQPTDDPAAIIASGLIHPMGGHKGSGLAVMLEALTGGLAGSDHSIEIRERLADKQTQHKSQFFLVLDPDAFSGTDAFARLVTSYTEAAAALPPLEPDGEVRLPGAGSAARRDRNLAEGIPLIPSVRKAVDTLTAFTQERAG